MKTIQVLLIIGTTSGGSFSLKTQTFENDATTTTNYSTYLDAQTIDFRWFLPFSIVFIVFIVFVLTAETI